MQAGLSAKVPKAADADAFKATTSFSKGKQKGKRAPTPCCSAELVGSTVEEAMDGMASTWAGRPQQGTGKQRHHNRKTVDIL